MIVFIPPLVAVLLARETEKGVALTEEEVLSLRDNSTCMELPEEVAAAMAKERGYRDIDPENVWEEWKNFSQ